MVIFEVPVRLSFDIVTRMKEELAVLVLVVLSTADTHSLRPDDAPRCHSMVLSDDNLHDWAQSEDISSFTVHRTVTVICHFSGDAGSLDN